MKVSCECFKMKKAGKPNGKCGVSKLTIVLLAKSSVGINFKLASVFNAYLMSLCYFYVELCCNYSKNCINNVQCIYFDVCVTIPINLPQL